MMLEKLLEELVGRRFDSLEHLKLTLDTDFRGIDSTVDYVDYEDMDEPEFWETHDLMINCSLNPNTDRDDYKDIELFYVLTRAKQIYITEVNPYAI